MVKEEIVALIEEVARDLGYSIYDYGLTVRGENSYIAVKIDSLEGISHQDCENYSRELSDRIDFADLVPNYTLEISSPGLNRKLRNKEEYIRFVKAPIKVVAEYEDKREAIKGTLLEVSEDGLLIKSEGKEITLSFDQIVQANLDY